MAVRSLVFATLVSCSIAPQYEIEPEGVNLEQLAGYGMLDGGVMEEVQRLAALERTDAVQAIISGTGLLAASDMPDAQALQQLVQSFVDGMEGETFLEIEDTPEKGRHRRALFIAACRTLAHEAKKRGAEEGDGWLDGMQEFDGAA